MATTSDPGEDRFPVIFLDIDGVLNTLETVKELSLPLQASSIAALNELIEKSGARVVISSSWRCYYDLAKIEEILNSYGFVGEIVGQTPVLRGAERGEEIKTWLQVHGEGVGAFVILDDHSDMSDARAQLVQTDAQEGLQKRHVQRALKILRNTSY